MDFSCGRDGTGIEGTLRGPRGPKKGTLKDQLWEARGIQDKGVIPRQQL